MGITAREFSTTMEVFGADRLPDTEISRLSMFVPCFSVKGIRFLHSGSDYIVDQDKKVPEEIMNQAMVECGETYPGGSNFWLDQIHSIRGILILATMLEGKYSEELVDKLFNETYKKMLECRLIQSNEDLPFTGTHSPKLQKLCKVLAEFNSVVNPFGSYNLRQPIEYLDNVSVYLSAKEDGNSQYARLIIKNKLAKTYFDIDANSWTYYSSVSTQKERKNGFIQLSHYYHNGKDGRPVDEGVTLYYSPIRKWKNTGVKPPEIIHLRISLKTGLAWEIYKGNHTLPATDEQIDLVISYLKISIKKLKKTILCNMITQNT